MYVVLLSSGESCLINRPLFLLCIKDMKVVEEKLQQKLKEDQETLEKERKLDRLREKVCTYIHMVER